MYVYGACLFYVCCSDRVGVCGNVCCVADVVKDSGGCFSLAVLKYVVCFCKGCDGCCVFVCIVTCGAVGVWEVDCFVMQMLYVCVLCASCGSSQCCILHDLQFVNASRQCKRQPNGRGILQSQSHDCLIDSHECLLLFTPSCCCECFYQL